MSEGRDVGIGLFMSARGLRSVLVARLVYKKAKPHQDVEGIRVVDFDGVVCFRFPLWRF